VTWIACGGSCDGGSTLIYVYSIRNKKLSLIWRIETGSLAEECGLKSLTVNKRIINLEVFRVCRLKGSTLEVKYNPLEHYKFDARGFTRFLFKFSGKTFALSRREAFTNYQEDVKNYQPAINISDD
jgi:hypothetical protein